MKEGIMYVITHVKAVFVHYDEHLSSYLI